jgi:hypothetical protein
MIRRSQEWTSVRLLLSWLVRLLRAALGCCWLLVSASMFSSGPKAGLGPGAALYGILGIACLVSVLWRRALPLVVAGSQTMVVAGLGLITLALFRGDQPLSGPAIITSMGLSARLLADFRNVLLQELGPVTMWATGIVTLQLALQAQGTGVFVASAAFAVLLLGVERRWRMPAGERPEPLGQATQPEH